jgi:autotransporter-associated beta strand protein
VSFPFRIVVALLASALTAGAQVLTETFRDATAPGWVFSGVNFTPTLTSGSPDPAGDGWLRLTSTGLNQATSAYYNTAFTATNATVYASFEYQSWGGTGADGITFFLFDGTQTFDVGADGGSLGYAQKTGVDGLKGGYLGIAIDEFGNFSNPTEGRIGGPGFTPDAFVVRGPGDGTTGYEYLGGTGTLTTSIDTPSVGTRPVVFNQVQMLLSPTNQLTVTLQQGGSSPQTVLALDLSGYARPDTLKYGFSSGTGSLTNYHEVRNLNVTTLVASLWDNGNGNSQWGTTNNWDPNVVPSAGSDILLNNTFVSTAQTIDTVANRTVRSVSIDAPFSYVVNNNTLTFDAAGVPGFSGIAVSQTRGIANHTVNSNLSLANDITVRNTSSGSLTLGGTVALGANDIVFDGSGAITATGIVSGTGTLTKNDAGTLTLNAANTYSGGTTLNAGTISTNSNTGLGTGALTLAGGTVVSTASNTLANTTTLTGNAGLSNLTLSGNLTQSGGNRTLTLNNATVSGNVALSESGTGRTLTVYTDTGSSSTLSGVISNGGAGAGGLTKTGAGTLTLSGANTYTGNTTVSAGTLQLGASNRISNSSSLDVAGGTFNLATHSEQVNNLTWSGGGEVNFGGTGNANYFLFQNATPAPTGVLTISGWETGSDIIASQTALSSGILEQFYFVGYGAGATQAAAQTVGSYGGGWRPINPNTAGWITWDSGDGTNRWDRNNNWNPNGVPASGTKVAFGTGAQTTVDVRGNRVVEAIRFDEGAASFTIAAINNAANTLTFNGPSSLAFIQQRSANNQTISVAGGVILTDNTVVDMIGAGNLTISAPLSGSGNLVKENTGGTLILSGSNGSYAGNISVNAGTLRASSSNALGNTTGTTTVAAGATLEIGTGSGLSIGEAITVSGAGVGGNGAIRNVAASGTNTLSGAVTLAGATTIGADAGGTLALSGGITSSANAALTVAGAGNVTVSSAITTGTGTLTIAGTGTTTLSGSAANTFSGTTTVNSGTLVLNKTAGTNAIAGNLVIGDGSGTDTVRLDASNQIANTAVVTVNSSGVLNLNNNDETIARLDGSAGASVTMGTGDLTISGSAESSYAGSFTGAVGSVLNKSGTGKLSLSGSSSSFAGNVNLSAGIINASGSATNMLGTGTVSVTGTGNLEVQGGATLANAMTLSSLGTGALDGAIQNIAGNNTVSGALTLTGNSRIQSDSGTLTVSGTTALGANNLNVGGAGNTTISNVVSGTGSLTKDGAGTLTLSAANTYTGTTTINNGTVALGASERLANTNVISLGALGTLNLAGFDETVASVSGSGSVDFGSAGTSALSLTSGVSSFSGQLLGTGELIIGAGATFTLGADLVNSNIKITLAGGTLNLNGYTGTLGNLSVTATSTIDFGSSANSTLNVQSIAFTGGGILNVNGWTDTQDFFTSVASPGAQGAAPTNQIVFSGFAGNDTRWQSFDQQVTPVPEPSTYGAMLLGAMAGLLGWRRWRRNRAAA